MRIFLTADTHGVLDIGKLHNFNILGAGAYLTKKDYVIILGDTAITWGSDKHDKKIQAQYEGFNWTTLYIDGNHDNSVKLNKLPTFDFYGGKASRITDNIIHLKRGEVYTFNNKTFLTIGGGLSIDKHYRTEGVDYWSTELLSQQEENKVLDIIKEYDYKVDYILSHVPPKEVVRLVNDTFKINDPVSKFLQYVYEIMKFEEWFCGHLHEDLTFGKVRILFDDVIEIN